MKTLTQKAMLLFALTASVFGSYCLADCHLGSNGEQYCGDVCAFNSDGTWSCYDNDRGDDHGDDGDSASCHLGSNGHQYCGRDCAFNSDGTWSCD